MPKGEGVSLDLLSEPCVQSSIFPLQMLFER